MTLDPPGGVYDEGQDVKVRAVPGPGYVFENWENDLSGGGPSELIFVNSDMAIRANFRPVMIGDNADSYIHHQDGGMVRLGLAKVEVPPEASDSNYVLTLKRIEDSKSGDNSFGAMRSGPPGPTSRRTSS